MASCDLKALEGLFGRANGCLMAELGFLDGGKSPQVG